MVSRNNNPKGIVFILFGMALFSIQDSLIKFIFNDVALYELYFGRTLVAALLLIVFLIYKKEKIILKTHYPILTVLRVTLFFFGFSFFYISFDFYDDGDGKCFIFFQSFFYVYFC